MLTAMQMEQYRAEGFTIVENLFTVADCDAIIRSAYAIVAAADASPEGVWLEPDAIERGLVREDNKQDYLFKIGHSMHLTDEVMRRYAGDGRMVEILSQLIGPDIMCIQSMFIDKPPNLGVGQPYHQDAHYLVTNPDTLMAAWIACDDVDEENGCLHVVPGSQDDPVHPHEKPLDPAQRVYEEVHSARLRQEIAVPLKQGSAVFFSGHVLHRSGNNFTERRRRAYVLHYADANSRWVDENDACSRETLLVRGNGSGKLQSPDRLLGTERTR
jgi:phytanoyl-CoA hydroxylase